MFIKSYYCCGTCKAEYTTKEEAIQCEEMGIQDKFPVGIKEGDEINFFDEITQMPIKGTYLGKIFLSAPQHSVHMACAVLRTEAFMQETKEPVIIERGVIFQPFLDSKKELKEKLVSQRQMSWREGFFEKVSLPQTQVLDIKPNTHPDPHGVHTK